MKNSIHFKMKTIGFMLFFSLISFSSCNNAEKTQSQDKEEKTEVKPPSMDLIAATFMGNIEAVKQHIEAGSDLNIKDEYGSTPLITACVFGRTKAALELIEGGADVNLQNNDGSTALHCAALFCHTEIVESLLSHGADKTIKNNYGDIPLNTVMAPFSEMKPAYDFFAKQLGPLGLKLDYEYIEKTRPIVASLLK